ncbi:MAG: hypothetical protein V3T72_23145 [Thermoanaerobaculia bacterium]
MKLSTAWVRVLPTFVLLTVLPFAAAAEKGGPLDADGDGVHAAADAFPDNPKATTDADGDGLGDRWERFWFGTLDQAEPDLDTDGDGKFNLAEFQANTNPVHGLVSPTCSWGEEDFYGGLDGYCTDNGGQNFDLYFEDWSGVEVFSESWPGPLANPPVTDCDELCEAGGLWVAYHTNRFNLNPGTDGLGPLAKNNLAAAPIPPGCPLTANAYEFYFQCDDGAEFRCHLACGKGCVGCEEHIVGGCGDGDPECWKFQLKCYQRDCCVIHDRCLAAANGDWWEEMKCHKQASDNGCGMADARGETNNNDDATCFDLPVQCLEEEGGFNEIPGDQLPEGGKARCSGG